MRASRRYTPYLVFPQRDTPVVLRPAYVHFRQTTPALVLPPSSGQSTFLPTGQRQIVQHPLFVITVVQAPLSPPPVQQPTFLFTGQRQLALRVGKLAVVQARMPVPGTQQPRLLTTGQRQLALRGPALQRSSGQSPRPTTLQPRWLPSSQKQAVAVVVSRAPQFLQVRQPASAPGRALQPQAFGVHAERDQRLTPVRSVQGVASRPQTQQPRFLPTGQREAVAVVVRRAAPLLSTQARQAPQPVPMQPFQRGVQPEREQRPAPLLRSTGVSPRPQTPQPQFFFAHPEGPLRPWPMLRAQGQPHRPQEQPPRLLPTHREPPVVTPRTPPFVQLRGDAYPLGARRGTTHLHGVHRETPPVILQRVPTVQRPWVALRPWQALLQGTTQFVLARKEGVAPPVVIYPARIFEATTRQFLFIATYDEQ